MKNKKEVRVLVCTSSFLSLQLTRGIRIRGAVFRTAASARDAFSAALS